jgi:hypothetical protein
MMPADGLMPLSVRNNNPKPSFSNNKISLGAMGDSIYEYMLKMWLQGGRKEQWLRDMYDQSMQGVHDKLLQKSSPSGLTYFAGEVICLYHIYCGFALFVYRYFPLSSLTSLLFFSLSPLNLRFEWWQARQKDGSPRMLHGWPLGSWCCH